jgi:hypothetical protein
MQEQSGLQLNFLSSSNEFIHKASTGHSCGNGPGCYYGILNGDLERQLYMYLLEGFKNKGDRNKVLLKKIAYRPKQSSRV